MGYNLEVGCHDCKVRASALRGQEAALISNFAGWHRIHAKAHGIAGTEIPRPARTDPQHHVDLRVDNGWSPLGGFPRTYTDVTDDLPVYREHIDLALDAEWSLTAGGQPVAVFDDYGDDLYTGVGPTVAVALTRLSAAIAHPTNH